MFELLWMVALQRIENSGSTVVCSDQSPLLQMQTSVGIRQTHLTPIKIDYHHVQVSNQFLKFLIGPTHAVSWPFERYTSSLSRNSASQLAKILDKQPRLLSSGFQLIWKSLTILMDVKDLPLRPWIAW
jgi:hypothetical protein